VIRKKCVYFAYGLDLTLLVAYLLAADIVSRLPSSRLSNANQPVLMTRNRCSSPRPRLLACI
jgi:hypothetical protein